MKNLKLELLHFVLPVLLFAAFIDPAVSQIIDPDKYYYIVNGQSSSKLGIMDSSSSKGAACVLTKSNGANTQFKFEPAGGDYYYIRAKHTNYALCIAGRNPANGVRLVQWSKQEAPHFMFRIEPAGGSGSYNIIAKHSNKALYIEGASNEEGTNCVQWDHETYDYHQMFRFSAVSSTSTRDPYNLGRPALESVRKAFPVALAGDEARDLARRPDEQPEREPEGHEDHHEVEHQIDAALPVAHIEQTSEPGVRGLPPRLAPHERQPAAEHRGVDGDVDQRPGAAQAPHGCPLLAEHATDDRPLRLGLVASQEDRHRGRTHS